MEIPEKRTVRPVNFKSVEGFVSPGVAGGFEDGQRSIGKLGKEGTGIINGYLLLFAGGGMNAFFDESFSHRIYLDDRTVQPDCGVNTMSKQITRYAAPCHLGIEPPQALAALRKIGADGPVLKKV